MNNIKSSKDYFNQYPQLVREFRFQYCARIHALSIEENNEIKYHSVLNAYRMRFKPRDNGKNTKSNAMRAEFRKTRKEMGQPVNDYVALIIATIKQKGLTIELKTGLHLYHRLYSTTYPARATKLPPKSDNQIWIENRIKEATYPVTREFYQAQLKRVTCQ
jgi:hypothetical protein